MISSIVSLIITCFLFVLNSLSGTDTVPILSVFHN